MITSEPITFAQAIMLCNHFDECNKEIGYHFGHTVIQDFNLNVDSIQWCLDNQFTRNGKAHPDWVADMGEAFPEGGYTELDIAKTFGFLNMLLSICAHQEDWFEGEED